MGDGGESGGISAERRRERSFCSPCERENKKSFVKDSFFPKGGETTLSFLIEAVLFLLDVYFKKDEGEGERREAF